MNLRTSIFLIVLASSFSFTAALAANPGETSKAAARDATGVVRPHSKVVKTPDLKIRDSRVTHDRELDLLIFEQRVAGRAGATVPRARGQMDGAPVLAYVFPTTLGSEDIGFGAVEGVVALAVTSHPDFDDTPLWDENRDRNYDNDGVVFHTHWVVLVPDSRVAGGLAVRTYVEGEKVTLPATHPGMPLYLDSPGFSVVLDGDTLRVLVPADRVHQKTDFRFDAVTAYLEVSLAEDRPRLGVYEVYQVQSGDLSLPYQVKSR